MTVRQVMRPIVEALMAAPGDRVPAALEKLSPQTTSAAWPSWTPIAWSSGHSQPQRCASRAHRATAGAMNQPSRASGVPRTTAVKREHEHRAADGATARAVVTKSTNTCLRGGIMKTSGRATGLASPAAIPPSPGTADHAVVPTGGGGRRPGQVDEHLARDPQGPTPVRPARSTGRPGTDPEAWTWSTVR